MIRTLNDEQMKHLMDLVIDYGSAVSNYEQPVFVKELLEIPYSYDPVLDKIGAIGFFLGSLPDLSDLEVNNDH